MVAPAGWRMLGTPRAARRTPSTAPRPTKDPTSILHRRRFSSRSPTDDAPCCRSEIGLVHASIPIGKARFCGRRASAKAESMAVCSRDRPPTSVECPVSAVGHCANLGPQQPGYRARSEGRRRPLRAAPRQRRARVAGARPSAAHENGAAPLRSAGGQRDSAARCSPDRWTDTCVPIRHPTAA